MNTDKYNEINGELRRITESLGYECAGFELVKEDGMDILRICLETSGGVDIADCERVSKPAGEYLDSIADVLPDRYYLEITSPGIERPLFTISDYARFVGENVMIYPKSGALFSGTISSADGDMIVVAEENGERRINFADIQRGHLLYVPKTGQKKTFKKIPKKNKK